MSKHPTKHGHARRSGFSAEYIAWRNMIARCERPSSPRFKDYGARGICVCDRWRTEFGFFLSDMGPKPSPAHTLERNRLNGNYEPNNCRWATDAEQRRNTSRTRYVIFQGERMPLVDAAAKAGIPYTRAKRRLALGWTHERAFQ